MGFLQAQIFVWPGPVPQNLGRQTGYQLLQFKGRLGADCLLSAMVILSLFEAFIRNEVLTGFRLTQVREGGGVS